MPLFLVNHHSNAVELTFPWRQNARFKDTNCYLPFNGMIDTSTVFPDLDHSSIHAIIVGSPIYQRFHAAGLVALLDTDAVETPPMHAKTLMIDVGDRGEELALLPPDAPPEAPRPVLPPDAEPAPLTIVPFPLKPGTTPEQALQERLEMEAAERAFAEAKQRAKKVQGFEIEDSEAVTTESADKRVLDQNVKNLLIDAQPSTKHTLEQLQEFAKKRKIDFTGLGKNALLKKLRSR